MSRGARWLIAVAVAAVTAGVWFAARGPASPPSDEELIGAAFADAARAASERRAGDVMKVVSERFHGGGLDRREVHQVVAGHTLRASWASVTVAGARVAVEGDRARANLDVVLAGASGKGKGIADLLPAEEAGSARRRGEGEARAIDASLYRFRCGLEREAEGWRVVTAEWSPISLAEALEGPEPPNP